LKVGNNNRGDEPAGRLVDSEGDKSFGLNKSYKARRRGRVGVPLYIYGLVGVSVFIIVFAFVFEARRAGGEGLPAGAGGDRVFGVQGELDGLGWVEQMFLPVNRFSRPGTELESVNGLVIHNIGNPGTTALQNRNYFANTVPAEEIFASAHFIVCLDGSVIQCIPVEEIAYASNIRNDDSIAIEVCHPDETGEFTGESYAAAVRLAAWLSIGYGLSTNDIIRHYDVEREGSPKLCPLFFVENEDAWERFKADVQNLIDRG